MQRAKYTIGVAGYMGSGKTAVALYLSREGASIIDADSVAKRLMNTDEKIKRELTAAFGYDVIEKGAVVFRLLGRRAFNTKEDLIRLNGIIHPPLLVELERLVNENRSGRSILDAALIPFWKIEGWFDALCWIEADFDVRFERLSRMLAMSAEEIRHRMVLQEEMFARPVHTKWIAVNNNGSMEELGRILASEAFARLRR